MSISSAPDSTFDDPRPRPNLFLVGAPKSGTTALATYLGEHPDVFMAPWELNFFGTDLSFRTSTGAPSRIRLEDYLSTFSSHGAQRYRGDHSVFYLYSGDSHEIRAFAPDARIVIILRNPVDQMYSEHSELLYQGDEDIPDFATALEAEKKDRALGRRIPAGCRKPFALQYRAVARYHDQVERYLKTFGPARVCVVVHDDLARDTAGEHRRVLEFLQVDPQHEPEFRVVNPNKAVRSATLRDVLRATTPTPARRFVASGAWWSEAIVPGDSFEGGSMSSTRGSAPADAGPGPAQPDPGGARRRHPAPGEPPGS